MCMATPCAYVREKNKKKEKKVRKEGKEVGIVHSELPMLINLPISL